MDQNDRTPRIVALQYTGVGFQFIGEAGVLSLLGWWCDGRLGTAPWLLVTGAMLGVVLATMNLIRNVQRLEDASKRRMKGDR